MSVNPTYLPVRKDNETIRKTVLTNIVKMLNNRKWISIENVPKQIESLIESYNDDHVYKIKLDVSLAKVSTYDPNDDGTAREHDKSFEDNVVIIKLLPQKVTSISKSPIIGEFLTNYKKNHKILVVDSISDKSKHQLMNGKYVEVFNESFLMIDLFSHVCSPKYEVLTPDETDEMLKSYHLIRKQMKRMYVTDPAAQYLYLRRKQVTRIIRHSEIAGLAIDYRIII